jgi:hypothetical protein
MKLRNFAVVLGLLALAACTRKPQGTTPEGALEDYVKTAFSARSTDDLKHMIDLSTGEAKEWLDSMTKETFEQQFVKNKMVLQSFTTKDKSQEKDGDVNLVYEIAFKDGSPDGNPTGPAVFTNKKIAYLHKDGNQWKVRATKNVKSVIERKDPLEILAQPEAPAAKEESGAKKK